MVACWTAVSHCFSGLKEAGVRLFSLLISSLSLAFKRILREAVYPSGSFLNCQSLFSGLKQTRGMLSSLVVACWTDYHWVLG